MQCTDVRRRGYVTIFKGESGIYVSNVWKKAKKASSRPGCTDESVKPSTTPVSGKWQGPVSGNVRLRPVPCHANNPVSCTLAIDTRDGLRSLSLLLRIEAPELVSKQFWCLVHGFSNKKRHKVWVPQTHFS
jgi:hypothetical protein